MFAVTRAQAAAPARPAHPDPLAERIVRSAANGLLDDYEAVITGAPLSQGAADLRAQLVGLIASGLVTLISGGAS